MTLINDKVKNIQNIIDSVNMKKIYKYFEKQPIAVYNDGFLYYMDEVIPFPSDIRESVALNKKYAVLNYEKLGNDDNLNAGRFIRRMVLNMFYERHDKRIPNDLIALRYPKIYLNFDYMRYERALLMKSIGANDKNIKLNFFRMFLNVRDLRRQIIGNEFSILEYNLETIEGLADYTMFKFISALDNRKVKEYMKPLINEYNIDSKDYFDFRHKNMYSGLMIAFILNELNFDIQAFFDNDNSFYQLATEKIKFIREPISYKSDKTLHDNLSKYEEEVREKFNLFFENEPKRVYGTYQIYAYDPKRMFIDKESIFHESFVVLKDLLTNELIKIEGPIVTKTVDNSIDVVTQYFYFDKSKNKRKRKKVE